jgi:hypothetical protein
LNPGGGKLKLNLLILILKWPLIVVVSIWLLVVELLEHPGALIRCETTLHIYPIWQLIPTLEGELL